MPSNNGSPVPPSETDPSKMPRSRGRSSSEDHGRVGGYPENGGGYPSPFPTQIYTQSPVYNSDPNNGNNNNMYPPPDGNYLSQSWGAGPSYPFPQPPVGFPPPPAGMHFPPPPQGPPAAVYGSSPYGMIDPGAGAMSWDPSLAQFSQQQPPQQTQSFRSNNSSSRGHKRTHSFGSASYGSGGPFEAAAGIGSHRRQGSSNSQRDFSPRDEFLKLAGRRPSIDSDSTNDSYQGGMGGPGGMGIGIAPPSPMQPSSMRGAAGGFPAISAEDMRVSFMDNGSVGSGVPATIPNQNGGGGEAVFLAQNSKRGKSHMRQRSAQLFMEDVKGQEQLPSCRDIVFLMLFFFQLLGMVYLGKKYGYQAERYHDDADGDVTIFYGNILYLTFLSGVVAVVVSACALFLFMAIAKKIVQIALFMAITLSFVWGTIGIGFSPSILVPASGFVALLLSVAYAFIVWDRIPFVAANLETGLQGIRANLGLVVLAFFFQALALGWSVYFVFVLVGVYDSILVGDIDIEDMNQDNSKTLIFVALGISYYWTIHVLMNIVQVTVAGLIGKWWYTPDGDISKRLSDLNASFFRSAFYGIGSICYGSLFVGPVRLLRQLSAFFRPNEGGTSSLLCLHQCLFCIQSCVTSCVDTLSDRYSPWAFTYVGLYGYGLVEGGQNASDLFEKRGWSTIVSDDLAPNVLLMTSVVIGGVTGLFAQVIESTETVTLSNLGQPALVSFCLGVAVGLVASSVLFGIITSAVHAVIVCFAASPVDFEQHHPKLSHEMRSAWREVWPGCMDVVDMRVAVATYLDPSMTERANENSPLMP
eukprot:scaffold328_cov130-Cylindrotheca_fusiformis.AAC.31